MEQFSIKPTIYKFQSAKEFVREFKLGPGDLVVTNEYIWQVFFAELDLTCDVICQEHYGAGEPSDEMIEAIASDITGDHRRVIGVGGGTVMDIAKLFSLAQYSPVIDLIDARIAAKRDKDLVLVPTTCGTGSEVTNISVVALLKRGTKKGLAAEALYADKAVIVPELLSTLALRPFATSSIDALVHAIESSLSPKANDITKMFSYKAMGIIVDGYQILADEGADARRDLLDGFLSASLYAGIAFGNAGCGTVHAMAYPIGATFHLAHGESNYVLLTDVLRSYLMEKHDGAIAEVLGFLAERLCCEPNDVLDRLDALLGAVMPKKALRELGMVDAQADTFAASVVQEQQRLLRNAFVPMDESHIAAIYRAAL